MGFLPLIPLLAFAIITLSLAARGISYRRSLLISALSCGLLVAVSTEVLSLFHALSFFPIVSLWLTATGLAFCYFRTWQWKVRIPKIRIRVSAATLCITVVASATFLIAIVSPPNTWDSMTYHMSRVMHWIQNGTVAHYPTGIPRQLYSAPWAEYTILHLQLLSGGDRFANLVQWGAMGGSLIGISLIAQEMGARPYMQAASAAFAATLPMGILQASSTQNDFVVSFWLVSFIYFGLVMQREWSLVNAMAVGCSLGLAMLTKATAAIVALPFMFWFLMGTFNRNGLRRFGYLGVIAFFMLILNSGHFQRNSALWGNPLATGTDRVTNEQISLSATLSNLSRNLVSNTWTPVEKLNLLMYGEVQILHDFLGIDINDPRTSVNNTRFEPAMTSYNEDYAGNCLHTIVFLCVLICLLPNLLKRPRPLHLQYALSVAASCLLFSMLLKWQPWITRLQLPLFITAAPLISSIIPSGQMKWLTEVCLGFLLICSLPWLLQNQTRPLLGGWTILNTERELLYFASNPGITNYYFARADIIQRHGVCFDIGVTGSVDAYEYPLWVLLGNRLTHRPRIEHILVDNVSSSIPHSEFTPCAVVKLL